MQTKQKLQLQLSIRKCKICLEKVENVVHLDCKHSYCKYCLNVWFRNIIGHIIVKTNLECPLCKDILEMTRINEILTSKNLTNYTKILQRPLTYNCEMCERPNTIDYATSIQHCLHCTYSSYRS